MSYFLPLHRIRHLPMLEWCRKVSTFKIGLQTNSDKFCQCDSNSICLNELSKWDEIYRPQVRNPISGPWNFSLCVIETAYLSNTVLNFKQGKKTPLFGHKKHLKLVTLSYEPLSNVGLVPMIQLKKHYNGSVRIWLCCVWETSL